MVASVKIAKCHGSEGVHESQVPTAQMNPHVVFSIYYGIELD